MTTATPSAVSTLTRVIGQPFFRCERRSVGAGAAESRPAWPAEPASAGIMRPRVRGRPPANGGRTVRRRASYGTRVCGRPRCCAGGAPRRTPAPFRPTCTGSRKPARLKPAVVDAASVLEQREELGRQVDADAAQRCGEQAHAERRQRDRPLPADRRHFRPGQQSVAGDVVDARARRGRARTGSSARRRPRARTGGEGRSRTATAPPATRAPSKRRDDVRSEHVREPQQRDVDVRVVLREVAHVALDRQQAALDRSCSVVSSEASPP